MARLRERGSSSVLARFGRQSRLWVGGDVLLSSFHVFLPRRFENRLSVRRLNALTYTVARYQRPHEMQSGSSGKNPFRCDDTRYRPRHTQGGKTPKAPWRRSCSEDEGYAVRGGMPGEKGGMSHHPVEERIGTACLTGPVRPRSAFGGSSTS